MVGVLEELELSLAVLERTLPRFFCGALDRYRHGAVTVQPQQGDAATARSGYPAHLEGESAADAAAPSTAPATVRTPPLKPPRTLPWDVERKIRAWLEDDLVLYAAATAKLRARASELGVDGAARGRGKTHEAADDEADDEAVAADNDGGDDAENLPIRSTPGCDTCTSPNSNAAPPKEATAQLQQRGGSYFSVKVE